MAAGEAPVMAPTAPNRRWRRVLLAAIIVAVLGFLLPPMVRLGSFKGRISTSMGNALGRNVSVGDVHLRLLPQPGFELSNVVISDDPAFGAEPMLRADEVIAIVRLASLWRGRLEIARLSLSYPSLNLVRSTNGRWNLESLLTRASQTPSAPTAQKHAEARPRFPYIEADNGRINLKFGQEKKVYALSDADFALWLSAEDEWSMRLAARPIRTDGNLTDTGRLKLEATFRRAAALRDTPLKVWLALDGAQLGQITTLMYGRDRGWRGAVDAKATLSGTPGALQISATAGVNDFRRYDVGTAETLRLQAGCTAQYSTSTDQLSQLDCRAPFDHGSLTVRGDIQQPIAPRAYDIAITAEKMPAQAVVMFARHAKKNLPDDLRAEGDLEAAFTVRRAANETRAHWDGGGLTSNLALRSATLGPELPLASLAFAIEGPGSAHDEQMARQPARVRQKQPPAAPELRVAVAPFHVPLGATAPADGSAWFSGDAYEFSVRGDARIPRVLQVGRALGLRVPQFTTDGTAKLDLKVLGKWMGFGAPTATGSAQLRNVVTPLNGVAASLQIEGANLVLAPEAAMLQNISAHLGTGLQFGGWVEIARGCETLESCPAQFDVQADQVALDDLNRLLNPALARRPWYDILEQSQPSVLMRLQARGHLTVNRLAIKTVAANRVTTNAVFEKGKLQFNDLRADVLGGRHRGTWRADFTGATPTYAGLGTLEGAAVAQLASLMHDNWAAGTIGAQYEVRLSGRRATDLATSAEGSATFDWRNGVLRHVTLNGQNGPLQFRDFAGKLAVRQGALTIEESRMMAAGGIYQVSGTASLNRQLTMKLRNGGRAYSISGPLEKPRVASVTEETQAALQR